MKTGTSDVKSLMVQVSAGQLRLPEIQRAYIWKPAQVAGLVDSLYRAYPSGSLLLWQTVDEITDRPIESAPPSTVNFNSPLYLLDGQQRVTSLHRVYTGHERARVVFNVVTERFQIESAATKKDRRWVPVGALLTGSVSTFTLVKELVEVVPDLEEEVIHDRLQQVRSIDNYTYWLEIIDDLPYSEVTEIFVRVNSRGRALRETDLALATLSARWPGVVGRVEERVKRSTARDYPALDATFLVRCLAALATETASPSSFVTVPIPDLEAAWSRLERGVDHLVSLLQDEVAIDNSALIPSVNALVPLVFWLGTRSDTPLAEEERKTLVYWLLVAFIQARYSGSVGTVISQDIAAVRSDNPLPTLYRNLGLVSHRPEVTPGSLAGKGSASPYFLLSYLVARRNKARDWWYGVPVKLSHDGMYRVEFHHIHPRARLADRYTKAEINDLANLAFISDKANRKISFRSPGAYFPELDESDLVGHSVPLDVSLRTVERFPDLVARRRELLAAAMTSLLESYRPAFLDSAFAQPIAATRTGLSIEAYGNRTEPESMVLLFASQYDDLVWNATVPVESVRAMLNDLGDGRGSEIEIGGEMIEIPGDAEVIEIPIGPLLVTGTVDEWERILARELAEPSTADEVPTIRAMSLWEGPRIAFAVIDSD